MVTVDGNEWLEYSMFRQCDSIEFRIDSKAILKSEIFPDCPMGWVIRIVNQFVVWNPVGRFAYGTLENPAACLEFESFEMTG
jgi:hypothetical protein